MVATYEALKTGEASLETATKDGHIIKTTYYASPDGPEHDVYETIIAVKNQRFNIPLTTKSVDEARENHERLVNSHNKDGL